MASLTRLGEAVRAIFGTDLHASRPLHGGDLSEVLLLELQDGRHVVAKSGKHVAQEAEMLRTIRATGAAAPEVLAVENTLLFLQALDETSASPRGWRDLGTGLRRLHDTHASGYGWHEDYAFGRVKIANRSLPDWPGFWAERRLRPGIPDLPRPLARRVELLCGRISEFLPARPAASLLHGDLWSGNVLFGAEGGAYLIDPASYYGHSEVDLAMLHLFAEPAREFQEAYGAPEPGFEARRAVYQLWPALVHFRLFGPGYLGMVESRLDRLGL